MIVQYSCECDSSNVLLPQRCIQGRVDLWVQLQTFDINVTREWVTVANPTPPQDNKFTTQGGALTYYSLDNMTSPGNRQATGFIAMPLCYKAFGRVHRLVSRSRSHHDSNILNTQNRERNMFNQPPQDFHLIFATILGVYRTHFKDTITRSRLYLKIKGPPSHQPRKRPETIKEDQVAMPQKSD